MFLLTSLFDVDVFWVCMVGFGSGEGAAEMDSVKNC